MKIEPGQIVNIDVSMGTKVQCKIIEQDRYEPGVWLAETTHKTAFFNKGEHIRPTAASITPASKPCEETDLLDWIVDEH